jgi:hypothetical protein
MTTRADYTDEEWAYITVAPIMAGMYISAVGSSGPIEILQKVDVLAHTVGELVHRGSANALIGSLIDELNSEQSETHGTLTVIPYHSQTLDTLHAATLDAIRKAAIVMSKARREEAAEYKALVMSLSQRVAQVAKGGGFLGVSGTPATEGAVRALQEIGAALGTMSQHRTMAARTRVRQRSSP